MNNTDFMRLTRKRTEARQNMGVAKGKEYANDETDRFQNFKRIGKQLGLSPETICMVYTLKHVDSLCHYVRHGCQDPGTEPIEGRIDDIQNYLDLLFGILREREGR